MEQKITNTPNYRMYMTELQPTNRLTNQVTNQSTNQLTNHLTKQLTNQSSKVFALTIIFAFATPRYWSSHISSLHQLLKCYHRRNSFILIRCEKKNMLQRSKMNSRIKVKKVGGWTNPPEKYAQVKLDHESPGIGVKIKIFETTT